MVPLAAIQAVPIAVIVWYRLQRYAWYRYSAIVKKTGNGELVTNRDQLVVVDNIESLIKVIRGQEVMLDKDLATPYVVETRTLNQAVKRNIQRFPSDFRFQLAMEEYSKSQIEEYHSFREI